MKEDKLKKQIPDEAESAKTACWSCKEKENSKFTKEIFKA